MGAILQAHGRAAAALKAPVAAAASSLVDARVPYVDETRYPREGSANGVWGVIQPKQTVFSILPSRARYVITNLIGEAPLGVLVSDRYADYAHIDAGRRQVCWAHLLRDFTRISQRGGRAERIGPRLLGLGCVRFRWRERGKATAEQFEPVMRRLRNSLEQGAAQFGCERTANTCTNLLKLWPALMGFITHPGMQSTNAAEQALRAIVLKRKISGPTRTRRGDEFIARGFAVHETCRRQGLDLWAYLHRAVIAWIDKAAPPSLLPAPTG